MVVAKTLEGSPQQIAAQILALQATRATVYVEESPQAPMPYDAAEERQFWSDLNALSAEAGPRVDDSREAIYRREES